MVLETSTLHRGLKYENDVQRPSEPDIFGSGRDSNRKLQVRTRRKWREREPQIRNYAPNMILKRKESASLVKGGTVHRMSP